MLLYRHSARCPAAMQWFLNCNPHFWPFVPLEKTRAHMDNAIYVMPSSIPADPTSPMVTESNRRSDLEAGTCLNDLPDLPSDDYTFSTRQCAEQFKIFKNKDNQLLPNNDLDLYNATIVAVCKFFLREKKGEKKILSLFLVPQDCSGPLQRIVEALFITHAETKLNTMGHLDVSVINSKVNINPHGITREGIIADRGHWCRNLLRPID